MKVLVTGATGFIGRHVVPYLIEKGHEVTAIARDENKAKTMTWFSKAKFITCDIHRDCLDQLDGYQAIVHLAWPGLPNYNELFHFENNLLADFKFLKTLVCNGVRHVLVAGTCFEYGLQNGCLKEDMPTQPLNPYALAKDTLRKFLQALQHKVPFTLQWVRLFYMYGHGQNPNSLLSQLDRAINKRESSFNMSGGQQLRDYLPVDEVGRRLVLLLEHPECEGIINICSGSPISVRQLVENYLSERGIRMSLNLNYYPYSSLEPMEFWGDNDKFKSITS